MSVLVGRLRPEDRSYPNRLVAKALARYGPAVVGVHDATRRIECGEVVTVDGAAGTVTIHDTMSTRATPAHR